MLTKKIQALKLSVLEKENGKSQRQQDIIILRLHFLKY